MTVEVEVHDDTARTLYGRCSSCHEVVPAKDGEALTIVKDIVRLRLWCSSCERTTMYAGRVDRDT